MAMSVMSKASSFGYLYLQLDHGREIDGIWCSCFTRGPDCQPPYLFVGHGMHTSTGTPGWMVIKKESLNG